MAASFALARWVTLPVDDASGDTEVSTARGCRLPGGDAATKQVLAGAVVPAGLRDSSTLQEATGGPRLRGADPGTGRAPLEKHLGTLVRSAVLA
jgi:hypothetical protein